MNPARQLYGQPRTQTCVELRDETALAAISQALRDAGHALVARRDDHRSIFRFLVAESIDVLLLDSASLETIPGGATRLHETCPRMGLLILAKGHDDGLAAMESGADDFIISPFQPREVALRVRAVLRRIRANNEPRTTIRVGAFEIDLERRSLRYNGELLHLTRREFDLVALLMQRAGTPLTHVQLLRAVWGPEYGNELEYLRVYMRTIRKKIEPDPNHPSFIRTEPGIGYYFAIPDPKLEVF